ncbi:MAG: PQQ-binding-like beta-propeller repeat protein [Planctomycetota bacterium]
MHAAAVQMMVANRVSRSLRTLRRRAASMLSIGLVSMFTLVSLTGCSWGEAREMEVDPYLLSLEEANEIGMNVVWSSKAALATNGRVSDVTVGNDLVLVTETGANVVSAIDATNGEPLWENAVGDPFEPLLGVAMTSDTVVAMTRSEVLQFDSANGRRLQFDRLSEEGPADTAPLLNWPFAIYGTTDGRVIFHHLPTGLMKSAYRFDTEVQQAPTAWDDLMVVITRDGYINVLVPDPNRPSRVWQHRVFDNIKARPATTSRRLIVAGMDRSLWGLDRRTGRIVWRWQTEYQLTDDPVTYDDAVVYQGVDNYAFAALDAENGQRIWLNEEVKGGTVLTQIDGHLIIWNRDADGIGGTFFRLNADDGRLVGAVRSRDIAYAVADAPIDGSIFGVEPRTGRMIKMSP